MTVSLLAIGGWLLAHPPALVLALVALGTVLLLVGLPLAVVRGVVWSRAAVAKWKYDDPAADRVTADVGEETSEGVDAPAPTE